MTDLTYSHIFASIARISGRLLIGYSGGVDSHVLLHLCATQNALRERILAVYVHHGLQTAADAWGEHCHQQAERLCVEFQEIRVDAKARNGESPEAAAREARYQALKPLLQTGDALLLAQHREDQMETLLLQLLRGAGLAGLAAMSQCSGFGKGVLMRPLLDVSKASILQYAVHHGLQWIEDPSNQSSDFDRNFLRNEILPLLKQRWPSIDRTVARSARHCAEALMLLDAWSTPVIDTLMGAQQTLDLQKWSAFNDEQRVWLLRIWLKRLGLRPPSQALLKTIECQLIDGREDAEACIKLQGRLLRKYRQHLYCLPEEHVVETSQSMVWHHDDELAWGWYGRLSVVPAAKGISRALWQGAEISVRPRQGGEVLRLPGRQGRHALKKLYQEAAIPPWERERRPLIYLNGRLAAVAGLWVDEWAYAVEPEPCHQVIWRYVDEH